MKKLKIALIALFIISGFTFSQSSQAVLISCDKLAIDNNGNSVAPDQVEEKWIHVQIPIPGVTTNCLDDTGNKTYVSKAYIQDLGAYIAGMYKWFSGAIGILSAVMILYGGLKWITAGGNRGNVQSAKEVVFSSLIALVIALGSYLLLYVINPSLVNLRPPALVMVKPIQQSFENCPTQGSCIAGTTIGKTCNGDSDCAAGGAGACDFGVELTGADWAPACGIEYSYKGTATANASGKPTCIGLVCGVPGRSGTVWDICASKSNFLKQPSSPEDATCASPDERCRLANNGSDISNPYCNKFSVPGLGVCVQVGRICVWGSKPEITCEPGQTRRSCGNCRSAGVNCPPQSSIYNPFEKLISSDVPGSCESDDINQRIYLGDLTEGSSSTTDMTLQGVCCQNGANYVCKTAP